jgi:hypothetical protein
MIDDSSIEAIDHPLVFLVPLFGVGTQSSGQILF